MPTILRVHDDPEARTILRTVLEREGHRVRTLVDLACLVEEARVCSLVVTSYPTPTPDGGSITRRVRADAATAHLPILNATTHAMGGEIEEATAEGVTATIVLPAAFGALAAVVRAPVGAP